MIVEGLVVVALGVGVYNFFTNASFKAKVLADATALESKVPGFVSTVKSVYGKVVAAVEADVKKL